VEDGCGLVELLFSNWWGWFFLRYLAEGQLASLGIYLAVTIGDKSHKLENWETISGAREGTHLSYFLRTLEHRLPRCSATLDDSSPVPCRSIFSRIQEGLSNSKLAGPGSSGTKRGKFVYPHGTPSLPSRRYTVWVKFTKTRPWSLDAARPLVQVAGTRPATSFLFCGT
jgi:hypothetical protein